MSDMNEEERKLFDTFRVYDNSLIHWERIRVAFGEDGDELKVARGLIQEAREELIRALTTIVGKGE
jgi:hypothetical protein